MAANIRRCSLQSARAWRIGGAWRVGRIFAGAWRRAFVFIRRCSLQSAAVACLAHQGRLRSKPPSSRIPFPKGPERRIMSCAYCGHGRAGSGRLPDSAIGVRVGSPAGPGTGPSRKARRTLPIDGRAGHYPRDGPGRLPDIAGRYPGRPGYCQASRPARDRFRSARAPGPPWPAAPATPPPPAASQPGSDRVQGSKACVSLATG